MFTVKDLREELAGLPDDTEITFGSTVAAVPLVFYRFKMRGDKLLQIELNEDFPMPGVYKVTVDEGLGSVWVDAPHLNLKPGKR